MDKAKRFSGEMAYHSGLAAEVSVEQYYSRHGYKLLARRWRGAEGEIDLIFDSNGDFVFVEVKKSTTFSTAASRVSWKQQQRIFATATEFIAEMPSGQLSDMRFDVALVDGTGAISVVENALHGD